jgi:acetoin utilization protein AcuB
MKSMPLVQKVMTAMPHTIGADIPLKKAKSMMSDYHIRHLPVLEGGQLVGILTERDIALASSFEGAAELKVEDVMMSMTYTVRPEASLDAVVAEMAERKYGSALVQQENGKVVGIFTAVDALRVLSEVLREHYKER